MITEFENIIFHNADNLSLMKTFKDKEFDWAIVDLEYCIGASKPSIKPNTVIQKNGTKLSVKQPNYIKKDWDFKLSSNEYLEELFRVSKKQIIFGGNYYGLSGGYLVWNKLNGESDQFGCEMAWLSFTKRMDIVHYLWCGMIQGIYCGTDMRKALVQQGNKKLNEKRIHPTQKPIKLYEYIINKYCSQNEKILDTHGGSMGIAIAVEKANKIDKKNIKLTIIELEESYYNDGINRFKQYKQQLTLF